MKIMRSLRAARPVLALVLGLAAAACGAEDTGPAEATGGSGDVSASGGSSAGGAPLTSVGGSGGSLPAASGGAEQMPSGGTSSGTGGAETSSGGAGDGGTLSSGGAMASSGGAPSSSGGAPASGGQPPGDLPPLTVFLAGDSTVQTYNDTPSPTDQAGWGQMFDALFDARITVDNRALGGRTSRRFIDEGHLAKIWSDAKEGDYLLVQFGTNDGHKTATYEINGQTIPYYLDPDTAFKEYLNMYIDGARDRGIVPVLVTPPPRNSAYCTGGNGTGAHAEAMRQLGQARQVTVLDLNERTVSHLKAICPAPTPEDFFLLRGDGTVDGTHFQENGARKLAGFVAAEIAASSEPLRHYLK